jgi:hypothetical protein
MITVNEELKEYMKSFKNRFGDIVPLREIPGSVTNEQLIDAIKKSMDSGENILSSEFGYSGRIDRIY